MAFGSSTLNIIGRPPSLAPLGIIFRDVWRSTVNVPLDATTKTTPKMAYFCKMMTEIK